MAIFPSDVALWDYCNGYDAGVGIAVSIRVISWVEAYGYCCIKVWCMLGARKNNHWCSTGWSRALELPPQSRRASVWTLLAGWGSSCVELACSPCPPQSKDMHVWLTIEVCLWTLRVVCLSVLVLHWTDELSGVCPPSCPETAGMGFWVAGVVGLNRLLRKWMQCVAWLPLAAQLLIIVT